MTRGYTLIEVVIALAIFAILGIMSVGLLSRAFDVKDRVAEVLGPVSEIELLITRITQDANQIVNRPVRDESLVLRNAFIAADDSIEFTRGGFVPLEKAINPSSLKRVALVCNNHKLFRDSWDKLDGFNPNHFNRQLIFDNLDDCSFSFLLDKNWSDAWSPSATPYPAAFRLNIKHASFGKAQFIFVIPGGIYDA